MGNAHEQLTASPSSTAANIVPENSITSSMMQYEAIIFAGVGKLVRQYSPWVAPHTVPTDLRTYLPTNPGWHNIPTHLRTYVPTCLPTYLPIYLPTYQPWLAP